MIGDFWKLDKYRMKLVFLQSGAIGASVFPITVGYYMGAKLIFGWNIYIAGILAGLTGTFWASNQLVMRKNTERLLKKKKYTRKEYVQERNRYNNRATISFFALILEAVLIINFNI
jgi:cytochrome b subunit of formate dehydrogenase